MAAEAVRMDFARLVSILDHRLANPSDISVRVQSHMTEARAAAQRGLDLSSELIGLLRAADLKK